MILFLKETFEGRAARDAILEMEGDNDLPIVASRLRFDDHMISVTDGIFSHRASFNPQGVERTSFGTGLLKDSAMCAIREHVKRGACRNSAYYRDTCWPSGEFDSSALSWRSDDPPLFFEHTKMVVNMTGTGNPQGTTNLANGWWHTLRLDEADNEIIDVSLEIAAWFHSHKAFPLPCILHGEQIRRFRTPFQR
jgi:hypothetical protein